MENARINARMGYTALSRETGIPRATVRHMLNGVGLATYLRWARLLPHTSHPDGCDGTGTAEGCRCGDALHKCCPYRHRECHQHSDNPDSSS